MSWFEIITIAILILFGGVLTYLMYHLHLTKEDMLNLIVRTEFLEEKVSQLKQKRKPLYEDVKMEITNTKE